MRCGYTALRMYWFLFRPAAAGVQCLIMCEGQVLLIRNTYGPRLWTIPGGGMQPGEQPEEAVRREVHEEVGITLGAVKFLGLFTGSDEYRRDTVYAFTASVRSQSHTIDPGEILEARWFSVNALPPLAGYAQQTVSLWREHGG